MARASLAAYDLAHASGTSQAKPIGKADRPFHAHVDGSARCSAAGKGERIEPREHIRGRDTQ
jgi:hypothetical protein